MTFAEKALHFYQRLTLTRPLPHQVRVLNPYQNDEAVRCARLFLNKYYSDQRQRFFVFGINPGRFGGGTTGVHFTDPLALETVCGIPNRFRKQRELSSEFIYRFIEKWGGARKFYGRFFLTAVSPLGFVKSGLNYNYYDDRAVFRALRPFIMKQLKEQLKLGAAKEAVIVFGSGKNLEYFSEMNRQLRYFKKIYPLEHPRFIMQYRRQRLNDFLKKYNDMFSSLL